jgi:hypothetical protein
VSVSVAASWWAGLREGEKVGGRDDPDVSYLLSGFGKSGEEVVPEGFIEFLFVVLINFHLDNEIKCEGMGGGIWGGRGTAGNPLAWEEIIVISPFWRGIGDRRVLLYLHVPFWVRGGGGGEFFTDMLAGDSVIFDVEVSGRHFCLACSI